MHQQYDTEKEARNYLMHQNDYWQKKLFIVENEYDENNPDCTNNIQILKLTKYEKNEFKSLSKIS